MHQLKRINNSPAWYKCQNQFKLFNSPPVPKPSQCEMWYNFNSVLFMAWLGSWATVSPAPAQDLSAARRNCCQSQLKSICTPLPPPRPPFQLMIIFSWSTPVRRPTESQCNDKSCLSWPGHGRTPQLLSSRSNSILQDSHFWRLPCHIYFIKFNPMKHSP